MIVTGECRTIASLLVTGPSSAPSIFRGPMPALCSTHSRVLQIALGIRFPWPFRQGIVGFWIDGFRRFSKLPGAGACETLVNPDLLAVLIELETVGTARNNRPITALEGAGFLLSLRNREAQKDVVNAVFTRISVCAGAPARVLV
jgi:hypothetical protein